MGNALGRGTVLWAVGAGLVIAAVGMGLWRVTELAALESSYETRPYTLAQLRAGPDSAEGRVRIGQTQLRAGQEAVFEFCAADALDPADWGGLVTVRLGKDGETVFDTVLGEEDLKRARRNSDGACLKLGSGKIKFDGQYTMDAVWETAPAAALLQVPVQARMLGRGKLAGGAKATLAMLGLGIALIVLGLWRRSGEPAAAGLWGNGRAEALPAPALGRSLLGAGIAMAALMGGTLLPMPGSDLAVVKGVLLTAVQAGLVAFLCKRLGEGPVLQQLALVRPTRAAVQLPAALVGGVLLVLSARVALRLVPSTGEAPIQTFLSWPSGMLAFAVLGVLVPLAEEVFFRGYLYRLALPLGRVGAFGVTWVIFVAMHAQQVWGNWGALLSITMTGAILTLLRAWTGSTLVPAIAHLLYNFALSYASL